MNPGHIHRIPPVVLSLFLVFSAAALAQDDPDLLDPAEPGSSLTEPDETIVGGELFQSVKSRLEAGEVRDAAKLIDQAVERSEEDTDSLDVHRSRQLVAAAFLRINNRRESYAQIRKLFEYELADVSDSESQKHIAATLTTLYQLAAQLKRTEETLADCDVAIKALEPLVEAGVPGDELDQLSKVRIVKARMLLDSDKPAAEKLLKSEYEQLADLYRKNPDNELAVAIFLRAISNVMALSQDDELKSTLFKEHQEIVTAKMEAEPNNLSYGIQYLAGIRFRLRDEATEDPLSASARIAEAREVIDRLIEADPAAERALDQYSNVFDRLDVLVNGQLKILQLLGTDAASLDDIAWVNGDPVTSEQRAGSVVLLDFWAIWNRPSIEAIDQYKTLWEKYSDNGLRIIGVTRHYNIDWDFERGTPRRSREPVSPETENETLTLFMEKRSIPWSSMVIENDKTLFDDFAVTGLPHAVLIDRQGKIRAIEIGVSDDVTKSLDDTIQKLLDED